MVLLGKRNRHALGRWIKHSMSSVLWFPSLLSCWLGKPSRQRLCFPCAARFVRKDFYRGQCSTYSFLVCGSPMQKLVEADWAIAEQLTVQAVQGLCFFRERLYSLPLTQVYGCALPNCRSILRRLTRPG